MFGTHLVISADSGQMSSALDTEYVPNLLYIKSAQNRSNNAVVEALLVKTSLVGKP